MYSTFYVAIFGRTLQMQACVCIVFTPTVAQCSIILWGLHCLVSGNQKHLLLETQHLLPLAHTAHTPPLLTHTGLYM